MNSYDLLNDKEFIASLKLLSTPIDFEQLEADGQLIKTGAWYQVNDINTLPDHVRKQIKNIKNDGKGNVLVKLPKSWAAFQRLYKRVTGKRYCD